MIKLDEEDYSLYMNRLYLFDEIRNLHLKKIGSGSEADIQKFNKEYLLKIYKLYKLVNMCISFYSSASYLFLKLLPHLNLF